MEHLRPGVAGAMVRALMALSLSRSESSLRTAPLAPKARARGEVGPWPGAESNCRHADFQSAALPTELPGRRTRNFISTNHFRKRERQWFVDAHRSQWD